MADEVLERDENSVPVMGALNDADEIQNLRVDNYDRLLVNSSSNGANDAFGRRRIAQPETIFDSKQLFDNQPLFWDDSEVSGGSTTSSHSVNRASTTIGVGETTAGKRVRQTFMRFNYQPGKGQEILMTGVLGTQPSGVVARMGYFDDQNGIFLENDSGTTSFGVRSYVSGSAVDTKVAQADWNVDKLDGTGASQLTLDVDKAQIFFTTIEWLGVGTVSVGFVINGQFVVCHNFNHANIIDSVYMSTPNLPLRYEIENDGTGGASTMEHICSSVISNGGLQNNGILRYSSTANTQVDCAVVGTLYAIKGIRLKSTHLDSTVKLLSSALIIQSASDDVEWQIVFDPTYSATPSWGNETNSAVQTFTGAGETVTNGTVITGGYLASGSGNNEAGSIQNAIENALLLGSKIDGTQQSIALCAKPLTNVNTLVEGSITWRELS